MWIYIYDSSHNVDSIPRPWSWHKGSLLSKSRHLGNIMLGLFDLHQAGGFFRLKLDMDAALTRLVDATWGSWCRELVMK